MASEASESVEVEACSAPKFLVQFQRTRSPSEAGDIFAQWESFTFKMETKKFLLAENLNVLVFFLRCSFPIGKTAHYDLTQASQH